MSRRNSNENNERPQESNAEVGRSGMCFPYNDFFVMCSQILTIVATCFLWMNTLTLFMSVFAMVVHQVVVFSYHMDKMSIRVLPVVSLLAALSFFSHGMIALGMVILDGIDEERYSEESCQVDIDQMIVAFFAFMGSLFWMGSYLCMSSFVERGRNAQWHALVLAASESDRAKQRASEITVLEGMEDDGQDEVEAK